MPKIKLENQSRLPVQDTYDRIKKVLETDGDLRRLDGKFACKFDDKTHSGKATGQFFSAELKVVEVAGGSHVQILVDLPLMMTPFKGVVEKTLQKKIESTLT